MRFIWAAGRQKTNRPQGSTRPACTTEPTNHKAPTILARGLSSLTQLAAQKWLRHCLKGEYILALTAATCWSLQRMDSRICPIATRAHRPWGFPKAPRMPVCRRSAPAHDSILLMRSTWKGCTLQAGTGCVSVIVRMPCAPGPAAPDAAMGTAEATVDREGSGPYHCT